MSNSDSYIVTACVVWEEEGQLWHVPSVCVKCGMGSPDWRVSVQHPLSKTPVYVLPWGEGKRLSR